jgi:hypothetical protein
MSSPSKTLDDRFEIQKVFVASITHIPDEDRDQLTTAYPGWAVIEYDSGLYVYLKEESEWDEVEDFDNYSYAFKKLVALARHLGCTHLRLDEDGEVYEGMETF